MIYEEEIAKLSYPEAPKIITTEIPGPKSKPILEKELANETPTRIAAIGLPMVWSEAFGATVKDLEDATDAPTGFKMTPENCYVTSLVGVGGTSSLRFNQEGTFNYVVEATSGAKTATGPLGTPRELKVKGTIIVQ